MIESSQIGHSALMASQDCFIVKKQEYHFCCCLNKELNLEIINVSDPTSFKVFNASFSTDSMPIDIKKIFSNVQQLFEFLKDSQQVYEVDWKNGQIKGYYRIDIKNEQKQIDWVIPLNEYTHSETENLTYAVRLLREEYRRQCEEFKKKHEDLLVEMAKSQSEIKSIKQENKIILVELDQLKYQSRKDHRKIILLFMILIFSILCFLFVAKNHHHRFTHNQIAITNKVNSFNAELEELMGFSFEEWKQMNISGIKALTLIDQWAKIPVDFGMLHLNKFRPIGERNVQYIGENGWDTQLLGRRSISKHPQFAIKIVSCTSLGIDIGITDRKYRTIRGIGSENHIVLTILKVKEGSKVTVFDMGREKSLLKRGDVIEVQVLLNSKTIRWMKNGQTFVEYESESLADQKIDWVPRIGMSTPSDEIMWIK